jgi:hypothetical protein
MRAYLPPISEMSKLWRLPLIAEFDFDAAMGAGRGSS